MSIKACLNLRVACLSIEACWTTSAEVCETCTLEGALNISKALAAVDLVRSKLLEVAGPELLASDHITRSRLSITPSFRFLYAVHLFR